MTARPENVSATFRASNTKADGTGTSYAPGASCSADESVTLYAQWTDGKIGSLPALVRDGCTFKGWYTLETGGTAVSENTVSRGYGAPPKYKTGDVRPVAARPPLQF